MINEGVKFVLTLKDYMSGQLPKIGRAAQSAFAKVDTGAKRAQKDIDLAGRSVNTLNRYLRNLERRRNISVDTHEIDEANRKIKMVESRIRNMTGGGPGYSPTAGGRGMSGGLFGGSLRRVAGIAAMVGGTAMLASGATRAANMGLQGGAQRISFQTMAGDQEGGKLYKDVTRFAQDSIFGNELYKNAQTQLAFGANAKEVMPTMRMLGDVSMGDKGRLESLNLAYSQVRSAGKLMGQDLLQFVNAGFNPLQTISEKTGRSMALLRKDMSDGKITFDMVRNSFIAATSAGGKFYKMTDRIAETPYGKVENLRGQIDGVMLQMGEAIAPSIGKAIDRYATPFVDFIGKSIMPKVGDIIDFGGEIAVPLAELARTTGKLVQPVADLIMSDEVKDLGKSLVELSAEVGKGLVPVMKDLTTIMRPIAGVVAGGITELITPSPDDIKIRKHIEQALNSTGRGAEAMKSEDSRLKLEKLNRHLNGKITPGGSLKDVWEAFQTNNNGSASIFGPQFTASGKSNNGKSVGEVLNNGGKGSGFVGVDAASKTDVITGGGSKTLNINVNASPFNIEKMMVEAGGGKLNGADIRWLQQQFAVWFDQMLESLGYSTNN